MFDLGFVSIATEQEAKSIEIVFCIQIRVFTLDLRESVNDCVPIYIKLSLHAAAHEEK